jgi:beta-lactam-binding protein with PASTA domain
LAVAQDLVSRSGRRLTFALIAVLLAFVVGHASAGARVGQADVSAATKVTVPNVVGLTWQTAGRRLRARDLRARVVYAKSLELVGTVVTQKPAAGARVIRRTRVSISVSSGPGP